MGGFWGGWFLNMAGGGGGAGGHRPFGRLFPEYGGGVKGAGAHASLRACLAANAYDLSATVALLLRVSEEVDEGDAADDEQSGGAAGAGALAADVKTAVSRGPAPGAVRS